MKISDELEKYLLGTEFSNGVSLKYKNDGAILERNPYLIEKLKEKKVLHVGFLDHLELIDEKRKSGTWLHQLLDDNCGRVIGIDINRKGIAKIAEDNPNLELLYCDLVADPIHNTITEDKWDYILLADVIEHIDAPVQMLNAVREKYGKYVDRIIVTTPNAFRYSNIRASLGSTELINSDHRYWFTPYTLAKISALAKLTDHSISLVEHGRLRRRNIPKRALLRIFPMLMDTLVLEAKVA